MVYISVFVLSPDVTNTTDYFLLVTQKEIKNNLFNSGGGALISAKSRNFSNLMRVKTESICSLFSPPFI